MAMEMESAAATHLLLSRPVIRGARPTASAAAPASHPFLDFLDAAFQVVPDTPAERVLPFFSLCTAAAIRASPSNAAVADQHRCNLRPVPRRRAPHGRRRRPEPLQPTASASPSSAAWAWPPSLTRAAATYG